MATRSPQRYLRLRWTAQLRCRGRVWRGSSIRMERCGGRRARRGGGGRGWFGGGPNGGGENLVRQVAILSTNGGVVAGGSVSRRVPTGWEALSGAGGRVAIFPGLGAALGLLASWLLSRRIKR